MSSIGFLPEGFYPLYRFLSLSNRQDRQFRSRPIIGSWEGALGMDGGGTALPLLPVVVPGKRAREPPELRSCDRSRSSLAKAAGL
jgi:hypothetical protein